MPKSYSEYVCQQCGYRSSSFLGKCPNCGEWNSLVETVVSPTSNSISSSTKPFSETLIKLSEVKSQHMKRISTGFTEFDRVLGGGIVPGSLVLISGDPGIGKSTLLLQTAMKISSQFRVHSSQKGQKQRPEATVNRKPSTENQHSVLYVTGEESAHQVKIRADRLLGPAGKWGGGYLDNLYILP